MQNIAASMIAAAASQDMLLVSLLLVGSMLIVFGLYQVLAEGRAETRSRIVDRLMERNTAAGQRGKKQADSIFRRRHDEHLGGLAAALSQARFIPKVQALLDQANVDWNASKMILNVALIAILLFCGLFAVKLPLYVGTLAAASVVALPFAWLQIRRGRRIAKLVNQLPDVFELLSQALRAGHSLASGIQLISEQMPDPIGTEFARVFHEQNMGIKIEEAMINMAERVDQLDVRLFVGAVIIQRQTGGDLAEILDKISGVIRSRIELFGMVRALTSEGRMSGCVLLALAPVVFLALLVINREYALTLLTDPEGKMMLFAAVGMQAMGAAMIKKITRIKV